MKIVLHIGAHGTDEDRLIGCLRQNTDQLAEQGIIVPDPQRYRPVIKEAFKSSNADKIPEASRDLILDAILDEDEPDRVVLSHDSFIGVPGNAIKDNKIYPTIGRKLRRMRDLFLPHEVEVFIALKDPGTFIPALFERAPEKSFETFLAGTDPLLLTWSETITRLQTALFDVPITVWANEDTPLLWPEILQAMSAHDSYTQLEGIDDFIKTIMMWRGYTKMQAYLEKSPPGSVKARRKVVGAFLERFPLPAEIETVIELPGSGWTADYVNALSTRYYRDLENIRDIKNVTFLEP